MKAHELLHAVRVTVASARERENGVKGGGGRRW